MKKSILFLFLAAASMSMQTQAQTTKKKPTRITNVVAQCYTQVWFDQSIGLYRTTTEHIPGYGYLDVVLMHLDNNQAGVARSIKLDNMRIKRGCGYKLVGTIQEEQSGFEDAKGRPLPKFVFYATTFQYDMSLPERTGSLTIKKISLF